MPVFPLAEFLPDQPDFNNPGSALIENAVWMTKQSVGPVGGFSPLLTALTARCQGAIGIRDSTGQPYVFAGDATKLYSAGAASSGFSDVSKVGGYAISTDQYWASAQYNDRIVFANIADPIQSYVIGSSSIFADLASGAPKCRTLAVVKNFLMVGNTSDGTFGARPQRVWWPDINDPTHWPTPGTAGAAAVQSDYQDVVGDHGWLQRIIPKVGTLDAALLFERAVYRVMYIGAPDIFGFYPAIGAKGCAAPGSACAVEGGVIYLSEDGFYFFDGQNSIPIGYGKVDKYFQDNLDPNEVSQVIATVDPVNKIYYVAFPTTDATQQTSNVILACSYLLPSVVGTQGRWSVITGVSVEYLFRAVAFGYTLDELDVFGTLDSLAFPFDSRNWSGGGLEILGGFNPSHELAYFNGTNLAATLETSETQIQKSRRTLVTNSIPLVDAGTPSVAAGTRARLQDSVSYGTASAMNAQGFCPVLAEGRYHRFRMTIPAGTDYTHAQGVEVPDDAYADAGSV